MTGDVEAAHKKAQEVFSAVSDVLDAPRNGVRSFFIPPDGSKEDWDVSNDWDEKRDEFILWMRDYRADEEDLEFGDNGLQWVEVQFADDDLETKVLRSSDHDAKARAEAEQAPV